MFPTGKLSMRAECSRAWTSAVQALRLKLESEHVSPISIPFLPLCTPSVRPPQVSVDTRLRTQTGNALPKKLAWEGCASFSYWSTMASATSINH